ncbi:bifunctional precorrin-2 dehydrogenase/sirohydrochlorin ferrochelatase [Salinigranum marinum]|uniref:precorrin-2 dehydrogenase/sirohydrochlorin ferrochelatase family protein n=1 Tax=Salinigranum marinum TaxID=1515595 RepID=UPI00298A0465|nr:bifunctional precorrin-2 dehydrogenase/sirohydrochlorin ferrochelatase [Salinigranum marinum]
MIPLVHDFTGRTVLVLGGGAVGARKARRFASEAHVVVVSPAFADGFDAADAAEATPETWQQTSDGPGVELVCDAPTPEGVERWIDRLDPALVVAATDDEAINAAAADAARDRDVLVNRTDRAGGRGGDVGSVVVPATVEDGSVTVAITTGGASPALSKHLRERLEAEIEGTGAMADLTRDLRAELRDRALSPTERRDAVRRVVRSSRVWKALRTGTTNARRVAEDVIGTDTTRTPESEGGEP